MRKRLLTVILMLMLSVLFTIPAYAGDTDEWINDWNYYVINSNPSNLIIKLKGYKGSDPEAHVYGRVMIDGVSYKVAVESYEVVNGPDSRYVSPFNTTEGTDIEELYFHAVDGQKVRVSNGASMAGMFYEMPSLRAIHFNDGFDVSNIWDATKMFYGDSGLEEGDFENLDFAYFSKAGSMFEGCSSLKEITIDFQAGNNFGSAFKGCTSLETVNITKGNANPSWKTYTGMFDGCEALRTVNLAGFDGASGESYSRMFRDCKSLESIDLSVLDLSATTDCSYMFSGCENLTALDLTQTSWNPSGVNMTGIIEGCTKLSELTTDESLVVSESTGEIGRVEDPVKVKVIGAMSESFAQNFFSKFRDANRYMEAIDVKADIALTGEDDYDALSYGLKYSDDERERIQDNAGSDSITFNAAAHGLYIYEPGEYTLTLTQGIRITDPGTGEETVQMLTEDDNGFKCQTNPLTKTINVTRNEDGSIQIEEV